MKNEDQQKNKTVVKRKPASPPDPRQAVFLSLYLDPTSETFSNALQSAVAAKYSKTYAERITGDLPDWLSENIRQMNMLSKAERNLHAILDLEEVVPAMGAFGPILQNGKKIGTKQEAVKDNDGKTVKLKSGKTKYKSVPKYERVPVMKIDTRLLNIKKDTTHFIAERLGRMIYKKVDPSPVDPSKTPAVIVAIQNNVNQDREKYA